MLRVRSRPLCALILAAAAAAVACGPPPSAHAEPTTTARAPLLQRRGAARAIFMGDSISAGLGASAPRHSYAALLARNDDRAYPAQAGRDLRHLFGPRLRVINVAHAGDTTADVLGEQLPRLDTPRDPADLGPSPVYGHTVVVLTIGGNDMRRNLSPAGSAAADAVLLRAVDNLRAVVHFFADPARFPDGASIYLGNVYDVTDGADQAHACLRGLAVPGMADSLRAWDVAYRHLAATADVHLVDLLGLFHGHGFNYADPHNPFFQADDATLWLSGRDCIHPNDRGHDQVRRAFYEAIAARLVVDVPAP